MSASAIISDPARESNTAQIIAFPYRRITAEQLDDIERKTGERLSPQQVGQIERLGALWRCQNAVDDQPKGCGATERDKSQPRVKLKPKPRPASDFYQNTLQN
jgi:hypothetical protein